MRNFPKVIGAIVIAIVILLLVAVLFAIPTLLLWNWLMPVLFGLKTITLFQAWGVNVLTGILFKSNYKSVKKD